MGKLILILGVMMLSEGVMAKRCRMYKPGESLPSYCSWVCIDGEWVKMCSK